MRFRAQRLVLVLIGLSVLFASGCDLFGWKNIGPVRSDGPVSVRTELRSITVDWTSLSQAEQAAAYELTIVDPKGNLVEILPLDASETDYTFLGDDERSGYYKFTLELLDAADFVYETHAVKAFYLNTDLPVMMIDVEGGEFLVEKKPALPAMVRVDPNGTEHESYEGSAGYRGRGNTTWGYPKKPYRVDLDKDAPLLGLASGKKWVLLAEFLEGSMLYNSIAFGAGHALEMPYTNTIVPVELIVNGEYQGMYVLTEQKEVADGRIPADEVALLLELDAHYDEDWQFKSKGYNLPVMVQYPKSKNMDEESLATIRSEFEALEAMITSSKFPNTDYLEYLDIDALVNYRGTFKMRNQLPAMNKYTL